MAPCMGHYTELDTCTVVLTGDNVIGNFERISIAYLHYGLSKGYRDKMQACSSHYGQYCMLRSDNCTMLRLL